MQKGILCQYSAGAHLVLVEVIWRSLGLRRQWVLTLDGVKSLASTHSLAAKPVPTLLLAACYTIASLLPLGKAVCPSSAKKVRNSPCTGSLLLTFL